MASGVNCCSCGGGDGGDECWTGPVAALGPAWCRVPLGPALESDAVVPAESEAVTPGAEAAVVEELAGSGGGGGGIGGDMVETRLPDTKLVGSSTLPGLGRRW